MTKRRGGYDIIRQMAYKDFVNDKNKGILKDVLLFYGAEDFLMNWAVDSIVNDYVDEAARDIDLIHLEGEQGTAADIMAQARAYSMFSERRVVVVRNYLPLYRKAADAGADELLRQRPQSNIYPAFAEFQNSRRDCSVDGVARILYVLAEGRASENEF